MQARNTPLKQLKRDVLSFNTVLAPFTRLRQSPVRVHLTPGFQPGQTLLQRTLNHASLPPIDTELLNIKSAIAPPEKTENPFSEPSPAFCGIIIFKVPRTANATKEV